MVVVGEAGGRREPTGDGERARAAAADERSAATSPPSTPPMATTPAAAPPLRGGEIRRSSLPSAPQAVGEENAPATRAESRGDGAGGVAVDGLRLLGGLTLVLLLIAALRFIASRWLGLRGLVAGDNRGVRVLSRSFMGPRQQLVLVQVGRKLVLLCDSAGRVTSVTEITDPDEVAELAAQAIGRGREADGLAPKAFAALLGWKAASFRGSTRDADDAGHDVADEPVGSDAAPSPAGDVTQSWTCDATAETAESGLSALTRHVRGISQRLGMVSTAPAAAAAAESTT